MHVFLELTGLIINNTNQSSYSLPLQRAQEGEYRDIASIPYSAPLPSPCCACKDEVRGEQGVQWPVRAVAGISEAAVVMGESGSKIWKECCSVRTPF